VTRPPVVAGREADFADFSKAVRGEMHQIRRAGRDGNKSDIPAQTNSSNQKRYGGR